MSRVLVIAAHPDDEILGVGSTVSKHIQNGDECSALILGEGMTSRYDSRDVANFSMIKELHKNTFDSAEIIGFKEVFLESLPDNRFDSVNLLDIIKIIEKYLEKLKPDIIYTHHGGDLNVDHRKTYEAVLTATRPIDNNEYPTEIYCFETVSSTEWNFEYSNSFRPNYFVDITDFIEFKLRAMECYESELKKFPHPRSIDNLKVSAQKWGSVIGVKYAEAFEVVRIIK